MMLRFEFLDPPLSGEVRILTFPRVRIGASSLNDLVLPGEGIRAYHAVVEMRKDQAWLLPGADSGELKVNGFPVSASHCLQPGDEIGIGSCRLRFDSKAFPTPETRRRASALEWFSLGVLGLALLGQLYFLAVHSVSIRRSVRPEFLRPPEPTPEPPPRQEATPTPVPTPPPPTPTPQPASLTPPELWERSRAALREGNHAAAENWLRQGLTLEPAEIRWKLELARLLSPAAERLEESIVLWEELSAKAPADSEAAVEAAMELPLLRRRKASLDAGTAPVRELPPPQTLPTPRPEFSIPPPAWNVPTPTPLPLPIQTPSLKLQNLRMQRYMDSPRYDELRMLNFAIAHQTNTPAVEAGSVKVRVTFFEQEGQRVREAQIPNPRLVIDPPQQMGGGRVYPDFSAAYEVPAGRGNANRSYYGAVIQLFIDGKEVDRAADPPFLLDYLRQP